MANIVPNIALGRVNELMIRVKNNDPTNSAIGVMLLQASESDALLKDRDTIDAILTQAANTEATFTDYSRQILTDVDITAPTPDDVNDRQDADLPNVTWVGAGGAVNNSLVKLIVYYDPDSTAGDDTTLVPLSIQDFVATTDGNDLTANIDPGFFRAS